MVEVILTIVVLAPIVTLTGYTFYLMWDDDPWIVFIVLGIVTWIILATVLLRQTSSKQAINNHGGELVSIQARD